MRDQIGGLLMSFKLQIPPVLLDTVKEAGYPPLDDILLSGVKLITLGVRRISLEVWIPDGPRSISFYRSPNHIHFDIEGCYSVLYIRENEVKVELLPDELLNSLSRLPVREFHRRLKSL